MFDLRTLSHGGNIGAAFLKSFTAARGGLQVGHVSHIVLWVCETPGVTSGRPGVLS